MRDKERRNITGGEGGEETHHSMRGGDTHHRKRGEETHHRMRAEERVGSPLYTDRLTILGYWWPAGPSGSSDPPWALVSGLIWGQSRLCSWGLLFHVLTDSLIPGCHAPEPPVSVN